MLGATNVTANEVVHISNSRCRRLLLCSTPRKADTDDASRILGHRLNDLRQRRSVNAPNSGLLSSAPFGVEGVAVERAARRDPFAAARLLGHGSSTPHVSKQRGGLCRTRGVVSL